MWQLAVVYILPVCKNIKKPQVVMSQNSDAFIRSSAISLVLQVATDSNGVFPVQSTTPATVTAFYVFKLSSHTSHYVTSKHRHVTQKVFL